MQVNAFATPPFINLSIIFLDASWAIWCYENYWDFFFISECTQFFISYKEQFFNIYSENIPTHSTSSIFKYFISGFHVMFRWFSGLLYSPYEREDISFLKSRPFPRHRVKKSPLGDILRGPWIYSSSWKGTFTTVWYIRPPFFIILFLYF